MRTGDAACGNAKVACLRGQPWQKRIFREVTMSKKRFVRGSRQCCDDHGDTFKGTKEVKKRDKKGRIRYRTVCAVCGLDVLDFFILADVFRV